MLRNVVLCLVITCVAAQPPPPPPPPGGTPFDLFLGNFRSDKTDKQVNMREAYVSLNMPLKTVEDSTGMDFLAVGPGRYSLNEYNIDTGAIIQKIYFKVGAENSTIMPGNMVLKFVVNIVDDHTFKIDYVFDKKIGLVLNVTLDYGADYSDFTCTDSPLLEGKRVTGSRHYIKALKMA